jgi:hypothetical protein
MAYAGNDTADTMRKVGDAWLPDEARYRLNEKRAYGGTYEILLNLEDRAVGRFLKVVFDKPQIGISDVLIPHVRAWGRVQDLSQLTSIRMKSRSAATADDVSGPSVQVFKEARWEEYRGRVGCPQNRYLRLLLEIRPLYEIPLNPTGVEGRLEARVL